MTTTTIISDKPLAPPPSFTSAKGIDWNGRYATLNPKWYQEHNVTRVAGALFLIASAGLAVMAKVASVSLTAKPIIVMYAVGGLALGSVALAVAGVYFLVKHCWNDPKYLAKHGMKEEREIYEKNRSYNEIAAAPLREQIPFDHNDYNGLFRDRIFDDKYSYLNLKALLSTKFENFGFVLDKANKGKLKEKLHAHIEKDRGYKISANERKELDLGEAEEAALFCGPLYNQLQSHEITYDKFIDQIGDNLKYFASPYTFYNPEVQAEIAKCGIQSYLNNNLGVKEAVSRSDAKFLNISIEDLVEAGAMNQDLLAVAAGSMSYQQIRDKHTFTAFSYLKERDILKEAFLKAPYKVMRENVTDAVLYGLETKTVVFERFKEEIAGICTFEQLLDKLGTSVFTDRFIDKTDERLKWMIVEFLKGHSYHIEDKSPLKTFDLLTDDVISAIDYSLGEENKTLTWYNTLKKAYDNTYETKKAETEAEYEATKRDTLGPLKIQLTALNLELERLIDDKEQVFKALVELTNQIKRHQQLKEIAAQGKANMRELEGQLLALKEQNDFKQLISKLEYKFQIEDEIAKIKMIPELKAESAKIQEQIVSLEAKIQALLNDPVTGLDKAQAARNESKRLKNEVAALKKRKEGIAARVEQANRLGELSVLEGKLKGGVEGTRETLKEAKAWVDQHEKALDGVKRTRAAVDGAEKELHEMLSIESLEGAKKRRMNDFDISCRMVDEKRAVVEARTHNIAKVTESIESAYRDVRENERATYQAEIDYLDKSRDEKLVHHQKTFIEKLKMIK